MKRITVIAAALLCVACARDQEPASEAALPTNETKYAPALGVDLGTMTKTPSGLYLQDVQVGNGPELKAGQRAVVHYTGWLPDGSEFDSSRKGGQPFELGVGQGEVIRGWDEGLQGMKAGGRRKLVIPPELAYGAAGIGGVIPPNATLVFDVELVEIR